MDKGEHPSESDSMVEIFETIVVVDLVTLTAKTTVVLDANMKNLEEAFLLTRARSIVNISFPNVTDGTEFILSYGDASTTEVDALLSTNSVVAQANQDDYRASQLATRRLIDHQTGPVKPDLADVDYSFEIEWRMTTRKGTPFRRQDGPQILAFNPASSGSLANGPTIRMTTRWMGAWMRS